MPDLVPPAAAATAAPVFAAEPAVDVRGVYKAFDGPPVLSDLWLRVPEGALIAVLGPNGAGKTTLLRVLAGLQRPDRGEVRVLGRPVHADPAVRRWIGLAGHASFLYASLTARENLRFYAALYGLPPARAEAVLDEFDLLPYGDVPVRALSRGLVQRLALARALLHEPRVLLLDEPFTGLDASAARVFAGRLDRLRRQGRAVVMTTHHWPEARELADRVAVLVRGRLAAHEPTSALDGARLVALYQGA